MLNTFFTVVFLVIILTTVYTNNLTTQLSEAELKKVTEELSNENDSALNKIKTGKIIIPNVCAHRRLHNILTNETKLICYNAYVDPEVGKMWRQFLKEKNYWLKHNLKWTIPMRKDEAVTERMKPFREKHNETNVDKETASSINDATLQTEIFGIKNNNVLSNTSANEYQDVHLSRIERDNIMFLLAQIRNNSNIIKEIGLKYTEMLELAKFMNGNYSFFNETGQKNISRRQLTKQGKLMEKMAQLKGIGQLKNERYREPYWKSGEYVFLRTGSPSTRSSKPTKKKDEKGNVKKDFMEELNETTTQNPMEVFRDCDRTCNYYFKTRVTCHQLDLLWYFLHRNRDVATSYNRSMTEKAHAKQKWKEITAILNAQADGGAHKDWAGWCKYWVDFKSKLKKRVATMRASNVQGGRSSMEKPLTEIEEKFLLILGDDFGLNAQGVRVEQPPESGAVHSQDSYESQPSILKNLVVEINGTDSPQECIPQVRLASSPSRTLPQSPPPENSSPRSGTLSPGPEALSPGPEALSPGPTLSPGPARRSPRRRRRWREPPMTQEAARRALVYASQKRAEAAVRMSNAMENAVDVLRRIERIFSAAYQQ